jgi:hypothetical protein
MSIPLSRHLRLIGRTPLTTTSDLGEGVQHNARRQLSLLTLVFVSCVAVCTQHQDDRAALAGRGGHPRYTRRHIIVVIIIIIITIIITIITIIIITTTTTNFHACRNHTCPITLASYFSSYLADTAAFHTPLLLS